MSKCPCGSKQQYSKCCEPLIKGERHAKTAQELMRARYTAYAKAEIDFIAATIDPKRKSEFNEKSATDWSRKSTWHSLEIIDTQKGEEQDDTGKVEFIAHYTQKTNKTYHHEIADFRKEDGKWYFVDGHTVPQKTVVRDKPKVGRNEPCPCGSGKKYKKCCG